MGVNLFRNKQFILPLLLVVALHPGQDLSADGVRQDPDREALLQKRREQLRLKWEQRFRAADVNDNRLLSMDEARAGKLPSRLIKRFADIDLDDDSQLSPEELWAAHKKRLDAQARRARPKKYR